MADKSLSPMETIRKQAMRFNKSIVLSEGEDPRVIKAGIRAQMEGIARVSLLGNKKAINKIADQEHLSVDTVELIDPLESPLLEIFSEKWHQLRAHKGLTARHARQQMSETLYFSQMLVREGHCDGSVGGAINSTADTVRSALQIIGMKPGSKVVSGTMLLLFQKPVNQQQRTMLFSDCAMVINPSAVELAHIAKSTSDTMTQLLQIVPKVAMLSFSTAGSAKHPDVEVVQQATTMLRKWSPSLKIDGEIQLDAAIVPEIADAKIPGSQLAGEANVLIFPNLAAANIGYKLVQRLAGAEAIGPILQGLNKPANDLSRGCSAQDILNLISITALQAAI